MQPGNTHCMHELYKADDQFVYCNRGCKPTPEKCFYAKWCIPLDKWVVSDKAKSYCRDFKD